VIRTVGFAIAAVLSLTLNASPELTHVERSRMSMACLYSIDAYGADAHRLPQLVEEALDEVDRIDRLMSHYKAESPLSEINREAGRHPVVVDSELFEFIRDALRYGRESDGAFDITIGPVMKAWGFFRGDGHLPSADDLRQARAQVGWQHVILDRRRRTIRFDRDGVELDLGGIAKGYAVDRVVALLRHGNVSAALVSAGGSTVYGIGAPPEHDAWQVTLQDPIKSTGSSQRLALKDRALSIAGTSEKFFEAGGVRYSHIMDPRLGRPVQGMLSVAVLTGSATAGDALDDALFVMGPEKSRALIKRLRATEVLFFVPHQPGGWKMIDERSR
jgi:thiamine biosynthesis lipoprotein